MSGLNFTRELHDSRRLVWVYLLMTGVQLRPTSGRVSLTVPNAA